LQALSIEEQQPELIEPKAIPFRYSSIPLVTVNLGSPAHGIQFGPV